jgi:nucleotide-binding universal stress UspA family protein
VALGAVVLVPLDGTPFAEGALPLARLVARLAGGSLLLAHVVIPPTPATDELGGVIVDLNAARELRRAVQEYLDDVVARMTRGASGGGAAATVPVRAVVLDGEPAEAVHDAAVSHGADLVVMASHDRSALGRLLMGSTAEHIAREPGVPVLIIRRHETTDRRSDDASVAAAGAGPATEEAARIRHVLVALDGSPEAEAVLPPALALARLMDAAVTLTAVHDTPRDRVTTLLPTAVLDPGAADAQRAVDAGVEAPEELAAYLDALARQLAGGGRRVDVRPVLGHDVAEAIVRCAGDVGADLIAMSTHGRGAWGRLVHGGVAGAVLHRVLMPVLLLRPRPTPAVPDTR